MSGKRSREKERRERKPVSVPGTWKKEGEEMNHCSSHPAPTENEATHIRNKESKKKIEWLLPLE